MTSENTSGGTSSSGERLVDGAPLASGGVSAAAGVGVVSRRRRCGRSGPGRWRGSRYAPALGGVVAVVVADALDPELGPQAPRWQQSLVAGGYSSSTISRSLFFQPRARAQGVELVLAEDVGGEAVGVGAACAARRRSAGRPRGAPA